MSYQHHYTDGTPIHYPLGKVVCIGRNYAEHAKELNNPVPTEPLLYQGRQLHRAAGRRLQHRAIVVRCITKRKSPC